MSTGAPTSKEWRQPSLLGLARLEINAMPAFEVLFLDEIAAYVMGSGDLEAPFTIEHGSKIASSLLGAIVNSAEYEPERLPATTSKMSEARKHVVGGAHAFADRGVPGLTQLVNRLIPAVTGELEIHKESPEQQTCSLFYYGLLAVASGPENLLDENAAAGVMEIFRAWDDQIGSGFVPPWRISTPD